MLVQHFIISVFNLALLHYQVHLSCQIVYFSYIHRLLVPISHIKSVRGIGIHFTYLTYQNNITLQSIFARLHCMHINKRAKFCYTNRYKLHTFIFVTLAFVTRCPNTDSSPCPAMLSIVNIIIQSTNQEMF